ncbi:hypothetical protein [Streptomyces tubercidicus]|uniref:hypothetical protein n=1 Tax=Streptomyces tubercidicus TaxID=47759 RepID=UPI0034671324
MTDDLRQRIADALTASAYQCDGKCGLGERACYDAHPITWSAMAGGTTHVDGSVTAIANIAFASVQADLDRLNQTIDYLKRNIRRSRDQVDSYDEELTGANSALDRVRALHQHNEDADYCDLCSNHGDITWPCSTIAALDRAKEA